MFTGLRSIIYPSKDLAADTKFWTKATGVKPYYEQPYYVGFQIGGCELGLDPNAITEGLPYPITYWLVEDTAAVSAQVLAAGATVNTKPKDVGGGMMMATFKDASGNIFGIIEHPKK